jgi:hypothetical protein
MPLTTFAPRPEALGRHVPEIRIEMTNSFIILPLLSIYCIRVSRVDEVTSNVMNA